MKKQIVAIALMFFVAAMGLVAEDKPKVSGGETFQVNVAYDKAYDISLNVIKKRDKTIESASKENGQILTALETSGGFIQTGNQVKITFIKDSDNQTTIRVLATTQHRVTGQTVHPWRDAKVDEKETAKIATEVRNALKPSGEGKK
jgi:uncharacterized protein YaaQ